MYCIWIEFGTPEFDEALQLRTEVLRKPLNLEFNPDDIAKEYDSFHLSCYTNDSELYGVLILKPISDQILKMRQVAVSVLSQKKGVGKLMVEESETFALKKGYSRIELNARLNAVSFYEKLNYITEGDIFQEVGIDHKFMYKNLKSL